MQRGSVLVQYEERYLTWEAFEIDGSFVAADPVRMVFRMHARVPDKDGELGARSCIFPASSGSGQLDASFLTEAQQDRLDHEHFIQNPDQKALFIAFCGIKSQLKGSVYGPLGSELCLNMTTDYYTLC